MKRLRRIYKNFTKAEEAFLGLLLVAITVLVFSSAVARALSAPIIVFLILLFLGMPIAFAIGISGFTFFLATPGGLPLTAVAKKAISTTQSFTMLAIPLFIFAGNLMNNTGITKRLVRLADVLTGHMYGNIAQVSCILSALMGGCSGSAAADAAMECRLLGPEMTERGYSNGWSAASTAGPP